jgi:hypothetical protein
MIGQNRVLLNQTASKFPLSRRFTYAPPVHRDTQLDDFAHGLLRY